MLSHVCATGLAATLMAVNAGAAPSRGVKSLEQLQQEFLELRFGMFICLGIATFNEVEWATGQEPASSFNPQDLDCGQWADVAAAAHMRYGLLTTKHVGGFALWDTAVSDYDVASSPYGKDIVRQYVDAFRERGLEIGLYFSIWDRHHGIERGHVTEEGLDHIKAQLRELLTNYGPVGMLWLDAYQHEKRGHPNFPSTTEVPFQEIYALVKGLQPNCLVLRHPGMAMYDTEYTDVQVWEGVFTHEATHAFWEQYMEEHPEGVQEVCEVLQPGWFWKKIMPERPVKSVDYIIGNLKTCNANNANYLPNSAVNRRGLLDDNLVSRLKEVGKAIEEQGVFDEHKEE